MAIDKTNSTSNGQALEINFKDSIIKHPEFIKVFKDEDRIKILHDENYHSVIGFLRKGPMTIDNLYTAFKEKGNEKSEKTIYRYLKQLKDSSIVELVGTRTSENESGDIKVENLYGRTASIFYFLYDTDEMCKNDACEREAFDKIGQTLEILLKTIYPSITKSKIEKITKIIEEWQWDAIENLSKQKIDHEALFEPLKNLEWKQVNHIMDSFKLLSIIPKFKELEKELVEDIELTA
ncbi:MAG: hypothetical protein ACFFD1_11065 [Candidatus Thorarchaeota archaeon]